jgi:hypothetical protein
MRVLATKHQLARRCGVDYRMIGRLRLSPHAQMPDGRPLYDVEETLCLLRRSQLNNRTEIDQEYGQKS